jgi:tetratricopeptide (TPR) repeat protein
MLQSPAAGVYRFHDLLRLFATELADSHVSADEADRAVGRLLLWYAQALRGAGHHFAQGRTPPPEAEPLPACGGAGIPDIPSHKAAMAWCEVEYPALEWAIEEAARRHRPGLAASMASWMWLYATRATVPSSHVTSQRIGLECARILGAPPVQAWLLNSLGLALARTGDYESAVGAYQEAIELRGRLGDMPGIAAGRNNIGNIRHEQGRYPEAIEHYLAAIELAEAAGWQHHVATILVNAANSNREMGAYTEALDAYSRALEIRTVAGSPYDAATCHSGIGETLLRLGRPDESLARHELAVAIHRDLGVRDRHFLEALDGLGHAYAECGRQDQARQCWTEAIRLADETGSPLAATLRERLPTQP